MYDYEPDLTETTVGGLRPGDQIIVWRDTDQPAMWLTHSRELMEDDTVAVRDYVSDIHPHLRDGYRWRTIETADGREWSLPESSPVVVRRAIRNEVPR